MTLTVPAPVVGTGALKINLVGKDWQDSVLHWTREAGARMGRV